MIEYSLVKNQRDFMHKLVSYIIPTYLIISLAGCATTPQQIPKIHPQVRHESLSSMTQWDITGKVAVRTKDQGHNISMDWHQNKDSYRVRFHSPFTSESAILTGDANEVILKTSDGKIYKNANPEVLLQEHLGWTIPFSHLKYWIKGMASPDSKAQVQKVDQHHQLQTLQQDGWLIEYQKYVVKYNMTYPDKITLSNGDTNIKLIVNDWKK